MTLAASARFALAAMFSALPAFDSPALASPEPRTFGGLTVTDPPATRTESTRGRLRLDIEGTLVTHDKRTWVGPTVPQHIPLGADRMELVRLIETPLPQTIVAPAIDTPAGHLALYREMFGRAGTSPGCALEDPHENCRQVARFYHADGRLGFEVDFNALFPRPTHLVVHDLLLVGDTLIYNEACQTYAADAKGKCSNIVALDISKTKPTVKWRSAPKLSRGDLLIVGPYLIAGYGFTDERDKLHVLELATGKLRHSVNVRKAPEVLNLVASHEGLALDAWLYGEDEARRFTISGFFGKDPTKPYEGTKPRLTPR